MQTTDTDKKLRQLFSNFQPQLSSDSLFLASLKSRMEAVEVVKRHNRVMHRRWRIAVVAAALSGFAAGMIMTHLFPLILTFISQQNITLPNAPTLVWQTISWLIVATVSVAIAKCTFDLSMQAASSRR